jgi:predicted RNA-binding Zn ribbon-like protein
MPAPMKFVGGLPCLDFLNTVGGWSMQRVIDDKLETYADLVRWAGLAGLVKPAVVQIQLARSNPRQAATVLARARALRHALHRLFNCAVDHRKPTAADLSILTAELQIARRHQTLSGSARQYQWTWDRAPALDSILWQVSQSAADLLTSRDLARVRRCAGENCGWMFLDTTRNHSRHWCDMQDCGNLAKVRRFRLRRVRPVKP